MAPHPSKRTISVPGFKFSGISAGIKGKKRDLALIYSERVASTAGVFTTNTVKASPVQVDISRIQSGVGQAIVVNSGNANACTGVRGIRDAYEMCDITARKLNIAPDLIYVASTGIIGRPLPMQLIRKGIPKAVKRLTPYSINDAARAIMTTDAFPKLVSRRIRLGSLTGTIIGIAKGAGMICPHMATMLCFICSDISISASALRQALREAVSVSFNRLTVDNDTSTNDTVIAMANGVLENHRLSRRAPLYGNFLGALKEITHELSFLIARDGEGATKVIFITVEGALSDRDAAKIARSIAGSSLVKTAMYGRDPNWGRIIAAAGSSGAAMDERKVVISINGCVVFRKGFVTGREYLARQTLSKREVTISVLLGIGRGSASMLSCDLTQEYVKINSAYST